jgi:Leucine-rich repeat (LRR) protein
MDQLRHLKHLNLSHNNLHHLPSSIFSLIKLNHLDASFNPLSRVSANAARLIHLKYLDLSNTDILSIPAELLTLSMTTIKTENCTRLEDQSFEIDQHLKHNPLSLRETCARQLIQPILYGIMTGKQSKRNKRLQKQRQLEFQLLPRHLVGYLSRPKACSSCGGPYYDSYVVRYRIVQRQDESWVPVEYRLCSAHWNTEKERLLTLFSEAPHTSLPPTTEPCHLKLVSKEASLEHGH